MSLSSTGRVAAASLTIPLSRPVSLVVHHSPPLVPSIIYPSRTFYHLPSIIYPSRTFYHLPLSYRTSADLQAPRH
jgi:hypothetical protein